MDELNKKVSGRIKKFVDEIIDEADHAESEERFFNKSMIGKGLNELYNGLNQDFIEVKQRLNQKKGMWGR